jgi:hypothetical protein
MITAPAMLPVMTTVEPPSAQALQDVLYDILAVGVDSDASATTASAIEGFLHEHARSPKPREAFVAFFREQGLSWSQARTLGAEPQALPPLKLVSPAGPRPIDLPARARASEASELGGSARDRAPAAHSDAWAALEPVAPAAPGPRGMALAVTALALVAVVLGLALGLGYRQLEQVSAQLDAAQAQSRNQAEALGAMQQRLAQVQAGVSDSGRRMARVEQQSALLLESLLPTTPAQ